MRTDYVFLSSLHLLLVLFFSSLAAICFIVPSSSFLLYSFIAFLSSEEMAFWAYFMGGALVFFTFLLVVGFHQLHKRNYYQITMKGAKTLVEESIIKDYVKEYWNTLFSQEDLSLDVIVGPNQKIEIIAEMPASEEENLFQRIENELGVLLARKLGYEKEFTLTLTSS